MKSKAQKITMWICISLLALQFLAAGLGKLRIQSSERWQHWGYTDGFMHFIGVLEVVGAIGLFIPGVRKWAAISLTGIMLGAAYTHVMHNEFTRLPHVTIVALLAGLVLWIDSRKQ
jgi:putative oxidoreductase